MTSCAYSIGAGEGDFAVSEQRALQCVCDYPGCPFPAALRRQDTAYNDESENWATFCHWHQEEADSYWAERWADYYQDVL